MNIRKLTRGAFGSSRKSGKMLLGLEALENRQLLATDVLVGVDGLDDISPAIGIGGTNPGDERIVVESTATQDIFNLQWFDADGSLVNLFYQGKGVVDVQLVGENPGESASAPTALPGDEGATLDNTLWRGVASVNVSGYDANSSMAIFAVGQQGEVGVPSSRVDVEGSGLSDLRTLTFGPSSTPGNDFFGPLNLGNAWFSYAAGETGIDAGNVSFGSVSVGDINATDGAVGILKLGSVQGGTIGVQGGGDLINDNGSKTFVSVNGFVPVSPNYIDQLAPGADTVDGTGQFIPGSTGSVLSIDQGFTGIPGQSVWNYGANRNVEFASFRTDVADDSRVFLPGTEGSGAPSFDPIDLNGSVGQADLDEWFANVTYLGEAYVYDPAPVFNGGGTENGGPVAADPLLVNVTGNVSADLVLGGFGSQDAPQSTNLLSGLKLDLGGRDFGASFEVGTVADLTVVDGNLDGVRFFSNGTVGDIEIVGNVSDTLVEVGSDLGSVPSPLGTMSGDSLRIDGDAADFRYFAERSAGSVEITGELSGESGIEVMLPSGLESVQVGPVSIGSTSGLVGATSGGAVYQVNGGAGANDSIGAVTVNDVRMKSGSFVALSDVESTVGLSLNSFDGGLGSNVLTLEDSIFGSLTIGTASGTSGLVLSDASSISDVRVQGDAGNWNVDATKGSSVGGFEVDGAAGRVGFEFDDSVLGEIGFGSLSNDLLISGFAAQFGPAVIAGNSGNIGLKLDGSAAGKISVGGSAGNVSVAAENRSSVGGIDVSGAAGEFEVTVSKSEIGSVGAQSANSGDFMFMDAVSGGIAIIDGLSGNFDLDGSETTFENGIVSGGSVNATIDLSGSVISGGDINLGNVSKVVSVDLSDSSTNGLILGNAGQFFLASNAQSAVSNVSGGRFNDVQIVADGFESRIGQVTVQGADDFSLQALNGGLIDGVAVANEVNDLVIQSDGVKSSIGAVTAGSVNKLDVDVTRQGTLDSVAVAGGNAEQIDVQVDGVNSFFGSDPVSFSGGGLNFAGAQEVIVNALNQGRVTMIGSDGFIDELSVVAAGAESKIGQLALNDGNELTLSAQSQGMIGGVSLTGSATKLDYSSIGAGTQIGGTQIDGGARDIVLNVSTKGAIADFAVGGASDNVTVNALTGEIGSLNLGSVELDLKFVGSDLSQVGNTTVGGDVGLLEVNGVRLNLGNLNLNSDVAVNAVDDVFLNLNDSNVGNIAMDELVNVFKVTGPEPISPVGVGGNLNAAFNSAIGNVTVRGDADTFEVALDGQSSLGAVQVGTAGGGNKLEVFDLVLGGSTFGDFNQDPAPALVVNGNLTEDLSINSQRFGLVESKVGDVKITGKALNVGVVLEDTLSVGMGDLTIGGESQTVAIALENSKMGDLSFGNSDASDVAVQSFSITGDAPDFFGEEETVGQMLFGGVVNYNVGTADSNLNLTELDVVGNVVVDLANPGSPFSGDLEVGGLAYGVNLDDVQAIDGKLTINGTNPVDPLDPFGLESGLGSLGDVFALDDVRFTTDLVLVPGANTVISPNSTGDSGGIVSQNGSVLIQGDLVLGEDARLGDITAGVDIKVGTNLSVPGQPVGGNVTLGENASLGNVTAANDLDVLNQFGSPLGTAGNVTLNGGTASIAGLNATNGTVNVEGSIVLSSEIGQISAGQDVVVRQDIRLEGDLSNIGNDSLAINAGNNIAIGRDVLLSGANTSIGGQPGVTGFSAGNDIVIGRDVVLSGENSLIGSDSDGFSAGNDVTITRDGVLSGANSSIGSGAQGISAGNNASFNQNLTLSGENSGIGQIDAANKVTIASNLSLSGAGSSIGGVFAGSGATDSNDDVLVGGNLALTGAGSSITTIQGLDSVQVSATTTVDGGGSSIGTIRSGDANNLVNNPSSGINLGGVVIGGDVTDSNRIGLIASSDANVTTGIIQVGLGGGTGNRIGDIRIIDTFVDNDPVTFSGGGVNWGTGVAPVIPGDPQYPSTINVSGRTGVVDEISVNLSGVSGIPSDMDLLLVHENSGVSSLLISDAGGKAAVNNLNLSFVPEWFGGVVNPLTSGGFVPTNLVGNPDIFPVPATGPAAPVGPYAAGFNGFEGLNPNSNWNLYVVDSAGKSAGSINGWSLDIFTEGTQAGNIAITDIQLFGNNSQVGNIASEDGSVTLELVINSKAQSGQVGNISGETGVSIGTLQATILGGVNSVVGDISAGSYDDALGLVSDPANVVLGAAASGTGLQNGSSIGNIQAYNGSILVNGPVNASGGSSIGNLSTGVFDTQTLAGEGNLFPVGTGGNVTFTGPVNLTDSLIGNIDLVNGNATFQGNVTLGVSNTSNPGLSSSIGDITIGRFSDGRSPDPSNIQTGGNLTFGGAVALTNSQIATGANGIQLENGGVSFNSSVTLVGTDTDAGSNGSGLVQSQLGNVQIGRLDADEAFISGGSVTFGGPVNLTESKVGNFDLVSGNLSFNQAVTAGVSDTTNSDLLSSIGDIKIGQAGGGVAGSGNLNFNQTLGLTNSTLAAGDGIELLDGSVTFTGAVTLTSAPLPGAPNPASIGDISVALGDLVITTGIGGSDETSVGNISLENGDLDLSSANTGIRLGNDSSIGKVTIGTGNVDLSGKNADIRLGNSSSIGDISIQKGSVSLSGENSNIELGDESSTGNIDLIEGDLALTGEDSDILLGNDSSIGKVTIGTGNVDLSGKNADIRLGNTSSIGDISIQKGSVSLSGEDSNIELGDESSIGNINLIEGDLALTGEESDIRVGNNSTIGNISLSDGDLKTTGGGTIQAGLIPLRDSAFAGDTGSSIGNITLLSGSIFGDAAVTQQGADISAGRIGNISLTNLTGPVLNDAVIRAVDFETNLPVGDAAMGSVSLIGNSAGGIAAGGPAQNPDASEISWEYGSQILSSGSIGNAVINNGDNPILSGSSSLVIAAGVNSVNNGSAAGEGMRLPAGLSGTVIPSIGDVNVTGSFTGNGLGDNNSYGEGFSIMAGLYTKAEAEFVGKAGVPLIGVPNGWFYNTVNQASIGDIVINDTSSTYDIDRGNTATIDAIQTGLSSVIAVNAISGDDIGTLTLQRAGVDFKTDLEPTVLEPFSHLTGGNPAVDNVLPTDLLVTLV